MNENPTPPPAEEPPPLVIPVRYMSPPGPLPQPAPRPRLPGMGLFRLLGSLLLAISIGFNLILFLMLFGNVDLGGLAGGFDSGGPAIHERFHSGKSDASEKIAIVRVEGVIMEGATAFAEKQIEKAARDPEVKAIVLEINSPGGSITASDDLHRRLIELRDGTTPRQKGGKKPIVVAMDALAASGGYYIAMPASYIMAQRTTITGSIGVYAAFPNIADFAQKNGVGLEIIKKGEVKDSGSMFHHMTAEERQVWQDMVDSAYQQFLAVVEAGRPELKGKLRKPLFEREIPKNPDQSDREAKGETVKYVRRLADGGIFTAAQAKEYGLIDGIGYLDDAVREAQKRADPSDPSREYRVVTYERPPSLMGSLLGGQASSAGLGLDTSKLAASATPRLWYLAPQSELAGLLAIFNR